MIVTPLDQSLFRTWSIISFGQQMKGLQSGMILQKAVQIRNPEFQDKLPKIDQHDDTYDMTHMTHIA